MPNYSAYLSPTKARMLPNQSRERSIASHALRQCWHYIFDFCPTLLAMYPPSGKAFLDDFLDHAEGESIPLNWRIFALIISLHKKNNTLTKELCAELLMAAAIRWTISDCTINQSIFLIEKKFGIAILGKKAANIDEDKVFTVLNHEATQESDDIFCSFSVARTPESHNDWDNFNYE